MYTWRSKTAEGRGRRHLVAKILAMVLVLKTSMMGGGTVGRSLLPMGQEYTASLGVWCGNMMREWAPLRGSLLQNDKGFVWRHVWQGERGLLHVKHRKRYRDAGGVGNARVGWGPCTPKQKEAVAGIAGVRWLEEKFVWPELLQKDGNYVYIGVPKEKKKKGYGEAD